MVKNLAKQLSRFFFSVGFSCIAVSMLLLLQRYWPNNFPELATASHSLTQATVTDSNTQPTLLTIPALNVELSISPAQKIENQWAIDSKTLSAIAPASEQLGWVIYGHNWPNLLGPLHAVNTGDHFEITFSDEVRRTYTVIGTTVVNPQQEEILLQVPNNHVLVYTCTGFFDRERLVVTLQLL